MNLRELLRMLRSSAGQAGADDYRVVGVWDVDAVPRHVDIVDVQLDVQEPRILLVLDSSGTRPPLAFAQLRGKLRALLWKAHGLDVYLLDEEVQHPNGWRSQELLEIDGVGLNPDTKLLGFIPVKGGFSTSV